MNRLRTWLAIEIILPSEQRRALREALFRDGEGLVDREKRLQQRSAAFHGTGGPPSWGPGATWPGPRNPQSRHG